MIIGDVGLKPLRASFDEDLLGLISKFHERTTTVLNAHLEWDQVFAANRLLGLVTLD